MAASLYGSVYHGKEKPGIWDLSFDRYEKEGDRRTLYAGESSSWNRSIPSRYGTWDSDSADSDVCFVWNDTGQLSSSSGDESILYFDDDVMLWRLLSVGAFSLQTEISENEYP